MPKGSQKTPQQAAAQEAINKRGTVKKVHRVSQQAKAAPSRGGGVGELRFYNQNDDAPGIKIGPTGVLFISLSFIATVIALHIFSKFRA